MNIPIGSLYVSEKFFTGLSTATIRNTMAQLEELGYITQPYTSAGRIPTEKGYRFYIDYLLHENQLSLNKKLTHALSNKFMVTEKASSNLFKEAAKTLSLYSHCLAIAIPPKAEEMILKRIKFINYERNKVLAVLISENGFVYNKIVELEKAFTQKQLDKASNHLNSKFNGQTIKELGDLITEQINNERIICDRLITNLLTFCKDIIKSDQDQLPFNSFAGTSNLPDFATMKQIKKILAAIEDKEFMLKLLHQASGYRGTKVFIGMENIIPALNELSMVISTYKNQQDSSGAIGIIGPTRMNYKEIIPMVEYAAETLTKILSV